MKLTQEDLLRAFAQSNVLAYFKHFLSIKNYKYNLATGFILSNDKDTERTLVSEFRSWVTGIRADIRGNDGMPGQFNATLSPSDAIELYKSEQYTDHIEHLKTRLKYDFAKKDIAMSELKRFTSILTGQDKELDVAALHSFIWQVKRKFFNLSVKHHLVPILYSNMQGSGKTINMLRLTLSKDQCQGTESNLLASLSASAQRSEGWDERTRSLFATNIIIKLDEMEIEKHQYNLVKALITGDTVEWRPMKTNDIITRKNKATLIATSNVPLDSLIFDETGVRRFYQINVRRFSDATKVKDATEQEQELQTIRFEDIWVGIDETLEYNDTYHSKFQDQFNVVAETTRNRGDFELFLNDAGVAPDGDIFIRTAWINAEFKQWASNNTSMNWLKKDYKRNFGKIGMNIIKTSGHDGYYVSLTEQAKEAYENWLNYDEVRYKIGII